MQMNLVDDSRLQTLLCNCGPAHDAHILSSGGSPGLLQTLVQSCRNKGKRSWTLDQRWSGAMGQDEAWHVKGAVIAPWSFSDVESSPAHDKRPGSTEHFLDDLAVIVGRSDAAITKQPIVEALSVVAQWPGHVDVGRRDKAIQ